MKPSEPDKRMMSGQIDKSIWDALNRMTENGLETKRSHLERALLRYVGPDNFEFEEDWQRLAGKYNITT